MQHWHLTPGDRSKSTEATNEHEVHRRASVMTWGGLRYYPKPTPIERDTRGYAASLFSTPRLEPDFTRSHTLSAGAAACQDWRCLSNQAEQAAEIDTDLHAPSNSQYCWV